MNNLFWLKSLLSISSVFSRVLHDFTPRFVGLSVRQLVGRMALLVRSYIFAPT